MRHFKAIFKQCVGKNSLVKKCKKYSTRPKLTILRRKTALMAKLATKMPPYYIQKWTFQKLGCKELLMHLTIINLDPPIIVGNPTGN